jgi:hypothetical protein
MKGKDLSYDTKLPAFLQKLKGELAGDPSGGQLSIPRPKKPKQDDGEDDPTYVLEDTNQSLSKAEYEALIAGEGVPEDFQTTPGGSDEVAQPGTNSKSNDKPESQQPKKPVTEAGTMARKRKAVKVVGNDEDEKDDQRQESKPTKKQKKKAKVIKLSFDE